MTRMPHRSAPTRPLAPQPRRVTVRTRAALALVVAAGAGLLGACSYTSPPTAVEPYTAADGVNVSAQVGDATLKLQNMLVVSAGKGTPGQLIGALTTTGSEAVGVQLTIGTAQTQVAVRPGVLTLIGPTGTPLVFDDVPVAAGSRLNVEVVTSDGGHQSVAVPVLPPTGYYASLSPSPTPSSSTSASPSATGTESPSPGPTESPSPTVTP